MADTSGLLAGEYEAINAHLRANIGQFVNWFSFFLTFSFAALAVFVATGERWPQPRLLSLGYAGHRADGPPPRPRGSARG